MDVNDIEPELGRYAPLMGAIMELNTERQIGQTVGPIPVSSIDAYLEKYKLPSWWAPVISRVDKHMLKLVADEMKSQSSG